LTKYWKIRVRVGSYVGLGLGLAQLLQSAHW